MTHTPTLEHIHEEIAQLAREARALHTLARERREQALLNLQERDKLVRLIEAWREIARQCHGDDIPEPEWSWDVDF